MKNQLAFMSFVGAIICTATCFAELNGYSKTGTVQPVSIKPLPLNRSQVQMTGKTLPVVSSRVTKEKVLSPIMEANAKEFTELKIWYNTVIRPQGSAKGEQGLNRKAEALAVYRGMP